MCSFEKKKAPNYCTADSQVTKCLERVWLGEHLYACLRYNRKYLTMIFFCRGNQEFCQTTLMHGCHSPNFRAYIPNFTNVKPSIEIQQKSFQFWLYTPETENTGTISGRINTLYVVLLHSYTLL